MSVRKNTSVFEGTVGPVIPCCLDAHALPPLPECITSRRPVPPLSQTFVQFRAERHDGKFLKWSILNDQWTVSHEYID